MNARNRHSLEALLVEGRLPLDAALQLAHAVVRSLEGHHATGQAIGPFDTTSCSVDLLGHVLVKPSLRTEAAAPELGVGAVPDLLSDLYSLGAVLYRLFSGLTPGEAMKRAGGHLAPPSRFNPSIDDALDGLVLTLLDADPMERPYRLAQVQGLLLAIFAELGLEPSTQAVASWVASHRPVLAVTKVETPARRAAPRIQWKLEEDEEVRSEVVDTAWEGPVRFDVWAAASAGVVALGVMLIALL